jgi:Zn-dependent M28 family amino/carboxypeptidase
MAVAARLRRHVEILADTIGPRNLEHTSAYEAARAHVRRELESCGLEVRDLPYRCGRHEVVNLEARLSGRRQGLSPVVIGAHYDTCGDTPGADDNASSVAGLIEIARQLTRAVDGAPRRPVRFVAFANEEPPHFMTQQMGSLVYARACRARGEELLGMLCLEMIGYFLTEPNSQPYPPQLPAVLRKTMPSRGNFVVLISDIGSSRFTYQLRRTIGLNARPDKSLPKLPIFAFGLPPMFTGGAHMLSDHWSFRQAGYQATMATDTAMVRNPHYHMPDDTADTLDYPRLAQLVLRLARGLGRL